MELAKYKLGDIVTLLNGRAYLMPELQDSGKYRILRVGNLSGGNDSWYYSDMELDENKYCENGDLLYAWACNFGPHIWREEKVIYHYHIWKLVENKEKVDRTYLYYYLLHQTPFYLGGVNGATMVHITKKNMEKKTVYIPSSLNVQHRIASILSTYDSLIENNTKRIRLLEKMAENLYKEWFSYGKIIKGGTIVRLADIIQITRGLSYSTAEIDCEEGLDLINLKNIQAYGGFRYDGTKKFCGKYKNEQIVCEGDLVMGVTDMTQDRRTVGSVALIPKTDKLSVISADLIKISSSISSVFLFGMFKYGNVSKYVAQFANGANVLHLRPKALHNIKVLLPNPNLINKYVDIVSPMVAEMNKLYVLSEKLARQRDLLLPRLMSGKLEVKEELLE